jgi:glucosamine-6-phosphate deaminase
MSIVRNSLVVPPPILKYQYKTTEKIPVKVWESVQEGCVHIAKSIALAIQQRQQEGEHIVLGLATGSSPIPVYNELVRLHREKGLSFRNVITFNLDEYYPIQPESEQSYVRFMHEYLFDHVDIPPQNIHIPDGTVPLEEVDALCKRYEKLISQFGGIDIQILGIGRSGHIGFNEPGSWEDSRTRLIRLDQVTRRDAVREFLRDEHVPYRAITMGIGTIMEARTLYLMAWGSHKAGILKEAVEHEPTPAVPAAYLQKHNNVKVYIDIPAAEELTRIRTPWQVGLCNWNEDLACRAVVWLSLKTNKPILKLTDDDYNGHQLSDLLVDFDDAYNINIRMFNRLQHTITGWPGGKPDADDNHRPERAAPKHKRVLIFSPHPDDDVISMGGTVMRLIEQGHEVHIAYQTSGNLAVHDHDALRYVECMQEFHALNRHSLNGDSSAAILDFLNNKKQGDVDIPEVRMIKGIIRRGEARAAARFCGIADAHIHFLDMPFYETGRTRKLPLSEDDVSLIEEILTRIQPHQVFAAGDLADPHGTHRVCLDAVTIAMTQMKDELWMQDCWLWLYRGAWHEWPVDEIEMAVPLSPKQLEKKRRAIFMHQSQKDKAPFPGDDSREFWQRAEDRNR